MYISDTFYKNLTQTLKNLFKIHHISSLYWQNCKGGSLTLILVPEKCFLCCQFSPGYGQISWSWPGLLVMARSPGHGQISWSWPVLLVMARSPGHGQISWSWPDGHGQITLSWPDLLVMARSDRVLNTVFSELHAYKVKNLLKYLQTKQSFCALVVLKLNWRSDWTDTEQSTPNTDLESGQVLKHFFYCDLPF